MNDDRMTVEVIKRHEGPSAKAFSESRRSDPTACFRQQQPDSATALARAAFGANTAGARPDHFVAAAY
jgi:hypothetical protein